MKIKTTLIFYFNPPHWQKSMEEPTTSGMDVEKKGTFVHCWWDCKLWTHYGNLWRTLKKLKTKSILRLSNSIPGICPKDSISYSNSFSVMFTDALFTIGRKWAHRKVHQLIDNEVYICTVEFTKPQRNRT